MDGHLTDYLVRRSRASWFAPSHATGQENPNQEDALQAKRDAVVLMSVSVPRRGAARGYPVRSCWPRRRGSPVCRPLDLDNNADPARARGNMCGCWVSRRRRSGRQPVGGTIRVWKTTDQRNTSCMMPSRATRGKAETSVSSVSHAGRAQINPICAAAPINRSPLARLQAGQSALSLTSRVTQRDAEIVAWTF